MSYKLLATFKSAISLHFLLGQTHRDTKYWSPRYHWPYSIRSWMKSVLPTSFLVSQKASSTQGLTFRPVCWLSYAMIDIDPGGNWSLRYCRAVQYHVNFYVWSSFMEEVHYHYQEQTRAKPSAWHCAKTWWISHPYKFTWGSGSHHGRLESLVITCTYLCENTLTQILGGTVSYTGWWKANYWKMMVLTKP